MSVTEHQNNKPTNEYLTEHHRDTLYNTWKLSVKDHHTTKQLTFYKKTLWSYNCLQEDNLYIHLKLKAKKVFKCLTLKLKQLWFRNLIAFQKSVHLNSNIILHQTSYIIKLTSLYKIFCLSFFHILVRI